MSEIREVAVANDVLEPLEPAELSVVRPPLLHLPGGFFRDQVKHILELLPVETLGGHRLQLLVHLGHLQGSKYVHMYTK